jgi:hypothetical protein
VALVAFELSPKDFGSVLICGKWVLQKKKILMFRQIEVLGFW